MKMHFPRKLKLFFWLQYLCPQEKRSVWGGWINKYSNHILLNAAIWFQHQLSFFFLISPLSSVGTIKKNSKTCPRNSLLFDLLWYLCMFIFFVTMIGLMYFPFLFLFPQCILGDQLHLISSCWVINPGGVHLQTLWACWVTFPHAPGSTGCIFTILPGWVPAAHLGALVLREMDSCPCASALAQSHTDWALTTGHSCSGHSQAPHPPCGSATVSSSCSHWRTEKSPFQKITGLGCGKGEEAPRRPCVQAITHLSSCLLKRPQGCCRKQPAFLIYQASLGVFIDSRGLNEKGFRKTTFRKKKEKVSKQCQRASIVHAALTWGKCLGVNL